MPHQHPAATIYEQPLNERMRAFLRLEYLFARVKHWCGGDDTWSSHNTLEAIIDIMALLSRSDLKHEFIKELERHSATLNGLKRNPNVDGSRLDAILDDIEGLLGELKQLENPPGSELKFHELIASVKQRTTIPAGTCAFDLPSYYHWLRQPADKRQVDLHEWLSPFDLVQRATGLCLTLVRESTSATQECAPGGFFKRSLDTNTPCQIVRVVLPADAGCFPEVSAGKHRFTVRFLEQPNPAARASQVDYDVDFDLLCCII